MRRQDEEMGSDRGLDFGDEAVGDETEAEESFDDEGEDGCDQDSEYSSQDRSDHSQFSSSYNTTWPLSYRQSIDMFSKVSSPKLNSLLGAGSLTRLGTSFLKPPSPGDSPTAGGPLDFAAAALLPDSDSLVCRDESVFSSVRKSFGSFHGMPKPTTHSSFAQAVVNGINVLCGVGLLSTPYAVKNGGWFGLFVLLALGSISCYTGILLKRCLDSSPGLRTYPDIGQAAFGTAGRYGIAAILYLELYASCVEYIILVGDNLSSLFPNAHVDIAGKSFLTCHQLFAVTATMTVLPTVWLRDLSLLSYLSAGGVVASIVVVICLLWVGVIDDVGFSPAGTLLDLKNLPVAIGLYGFCFAGHSVFPNIYSSMKKRSQFPAVLIVCFALCTCVYAGVAAAGFLMFGDSVTSQITLNMPHQLFASKVAVWTTVVNPLTKYALTITPVALSLEELLPESQLQYHSVSVMIRTALVLSTLLVALMFPFFGFVMALIGSVLTMLVALILPCLCYLSIKRRSVSQSQIAVCTLITAVGVACSSAGSYTTIRKIIQGSD